MSTQKTLLLHLKCVNGIMLLIKLLLGGGGGTLISAMQVSTSTVLCNIMFIAATVVASKNCEADGLSRRHHWVLG